MGHIGLHCDPSYLAKTERAERPVPATLAQSCDHVLDTQGMLVRLHALAESNRDLTAKLGSETPAHVADNAAHVASPTGNLTGGATFPAAPDTGPDTGEEIVVPARTADGRVVFVSVPRRVFLQGLSSAAVDLTATPAVVPSAADVHPAQSFQNAIADLPSDRRRDRGVYLARAALVHTGDRQVEHAATLGLDALAIGAETGSARILTELARRNDALAPWNTVPAVTDFRSATKNTLSRQA